MNCSELVLQVGKTPSQASPDFSQVRQTRDGIVGVDMTNSGRIRIIVRKKKIRVPWDGMFMLEQLATERKWREYMLRYEARLV